MRRLAALLVGACLLLLAGCADETVYDWQRPHQTYQAASYSEGGKAEDMKVKLQRNGFASRIETGIKDGHYQYNVLVDIYDLKSDSLAKVESVTGVRPSIRNNNASKPQQNSIPTGDI